MNFEQALNQMESLADKHFAVYTIQTDKYCDGDWKIEVCHVPETGYVHKFVYSNMASKTFYHRKLEVNQDEVIEVMEHPPPTGGLGFETSKEGNATFVNIGSLPNL